MARIVGIGANVYDTLITLDHYPAEDTKLKAQALRECGGGPVGTGLVAAAKLGESAAYIGALAADGGGQFLRADMKRFGVSDALVSTDEDATSFSSVIWLSRSNATRTCVFSKSNLPRWDMTAERAAAISAAEILMVDGNDLQGAIAGARIAKAAGTKVLYDAGGLYPGIEELLPFADYLIPSEEFALAHTGKATAKEAALSLYERYTPLLVVITCGKEGGVVYDGKELKRYAAHSVKAIDTNGAGDVFHGAFAVAMLRGYDPYTACIFAGAVSALKCTKEGARDGVPALAETLAFLKEKGYEF